MAPTVPTEWPSKITAGMTFKVLRSFNDFPVSDGWSLAVYIVGPSILGPVAATTSGSSFSVVLSTTDTGSLAAGTYTVREIATKSGESYVASSSVLVVEQNIASAAAGDMQSWEEKTLVVVEAALSGRLTSDMESYQIAGRMVTKIPIRDLLKIRGELIAAIRAQRSPGTFGSEVKIYFNGVDY